MPSNLVKTDRDERLWSKATTAAEKQGKGENYAYINGIYQRMKGHTKTASITGRIAGPGETGVADTSGWKIPVQLRGKLEQQTLKDPRLVYRVGRAKGGLLLSKFDGKTFNPGDYLIMHPERKKWLMSQGKPIAKTASLLGRLFPQKSSWEKKVERQGKEMRDARQRWLQSATPQQLQVEREIAEAPLGIPIKYLPEHLRDHAVVLRDDLSGHDHYVRSKSDGKLYALGNERFWDTKDPANIDIREVTPEEVEEMRGLQGKSIAKTAERTVMRTPLLDGIRKQAGIGLLFSDIRRSGMSDEQYGELGDRKWYNRELGVLPAATVGAVTGGMWIPTIAKAIRLKSMEVTPRMNLLGALAGATVLPAIHWLTSMKRDPRYRSPGKPQG